jgi:type I restriction enzyme S subunit
MTEKTLEDVCNILPRSKRNTKYGSKKGNYPFFKGSSIVDSFVDEPDYEGESLIICDSGEPNINYAYEFSASDNCYILQNKNKSLLNLKFVYYYLYNNLDIMNNLYIGNEIKHISKANIKSIKIPFPSLEKQNEIVEYCENSDMNIKQLEEEIENNKIRMVQYMKDCKKIKDLWVPYKKLQDTYIFK